jgi:hypothetical protein
MELHFFHNSQFKFKHGLYNHKGNKKFGNGRLLFAQPGNRFAGCRTAVVAPPHKAGDYKRMAGTKVDEGNERRKPQLKAIVTSCFRLFPKFSSFLNYHIFHFSFPLPPLTFAAK